MSQPSHEDFHDLEAEKGCCIFCGHPLDSRPIFRDCDEEEIFCPECGYVEGIE